MTKDNDDAIPKIRVSHFLTGDDDRTIGRVTFLSKPAEWHALMVGVLAVFAPEVVTAAGLPPTVSSALGPGFAASYVAGRSIKDVARNMGDKVTTKHIKDSLAEPAYLSAGYVLARGVGEILSAFPF